MSSSEPIHVSTRRERRRRTRLRVWNGLVMGVGYLTIAYSLARGVIYLLVLAREWTAK